MKWMRKPQKQEVLRRYENGEAMHTIAESMSVSSGTIHRVLHMAGANVRPHRQYTCDDHYFDVIDTATKAYWLGFIAADGCVTRDDTTLQIKIHKNDVHLLGAFQRDIDATNPICYRENYVGISIWSSTLCAGLMSHGITPRKSLTLQPPTGVPRELVPHFIRGYFDGDGCITRGKNPIWSVVGTKEMMEWIAASIISVCGFSMPTLRPVGNVFVLACGGSIKLTAIRNYLYPSGDDFPCLPRKRERLAEVRIKIKLKAS